MRNFIIGTDWWTDCDDAVAMRILARAHKNKEINILGIGINACMEYSVSSLDGFLNSEGLDTIPLGIDLEATDFGGQPSYQKNLSPFANRYFTNTDAENAVKLYRRLLANSNEPVEIIEIGYLQVIAAVIESEPDEISPKNGIELIKEKVSKIWVMAGKWDEDLGKENNFARNMRSRKAGYIFCEKCPVPIVFLGFEIGLNVITGDNLNENDILFRALYDHGSPNGRHSWDPMLVLMAIIGNENKAGYKVVKGYANVDPNTGENRFIPDSKGPHGYVIKIYKDDYYKNKINKLI